MSPVRWGVVCEHGIKRDDWKTEMSNLAKKKSPKQNAKLIAPTAELKRFNITNRVGRPAGA